MSAAFRREFLGASATVRVEAAFGADLAVNEAAWVWTDITTDVLYASYAGVTIPSIGRSSGSGTAPPADFNFALKNDSGNYTAYSPSSIYYPYIRRNTPVRVVVNLTGNAVDDSIRAQGYANGWVPSWDVRGGHSTVKVSCSGVLRRLQQGSRALHSAIYRSTIAAPGLVSYAPMEEDAGSSAISALGLASNALFGGTVTFAADNTLGGGKQSIALDGTSYLALTAEGRVFSNHWQIDWFMKFGGSAPASETVVMRGRTDYSPASLVDAVYGGGNWGVRVYDIGGNSVATAIFGLPAGVPTGWWHWRLMAHDAGSGNTDYQLVVFPEGLTSSGFTATATAAAVPGNMTNAYVLPTALLSGVAMSHWAILDNFNYSAVDASSDGYDGELATSRLSRLGREESIPITLSATGAITMGAQRPGNQHSLLRESEAADGGVLFDGRDAGLTHVSETSRQNIAAAMTLSASSKHLIGAPVPLDDDQRNINQSTVTLTGGGSATYEQFGGPLGSDTIGVYESSASVNLETVAEALDLASWLVHLGQTEGFRYAQLALDLIGIAKRTGTTIPAAWLDCTVGSRIDLTGLRAVAATHPPGDVQLVLEGWSETITPKTWTAVANCSPYQPWDVGLLDSYWLDCGRSVLGTAMTTSSTTMDVLVSDGCDWTHADGDYSITVGGEEMTVTAVGATTTPTPALVAVGTGATGNAAPVTPGLPGGSTAAGNLLLMLASVRDTNAVATDMYVTGSPGWVKLFDGVNLAMFAKVHTGSEVAPTVHYVSGISGDTILAQIASFSGKWGDPKSQLVAVAQQENAAAQNIPYPGLDVQLGGLLIVWSAWKADDWTSVATLTNEISELTSTLGNDAGIVWDYNTSAGVPSVGAGSFIVTGGTSQISRAALIALRSVYQTLTVTRGVNGFTRAHPIGEEVHVTHPLIATRQ